jgi:signal transduction histidine kinase
MPHSDTPAVRILVVEDDEAIRCTLADILELNGYEVLQAEDGDQGLSLALVHLPDLILTDIAMPRLDGLAMIDALHSNERTRPIPVIIVSASVELERIRAGMDRGAEDYLIKPFTEDQVLRSIKARMEKKTLVDELDAFAHTVAHDLKNPIASLMARAVLLRLGWAEADEAQKLEHLREIEVGAKRLAAIVDELLLLAGVRREAVVLQPVDMAAAVREALTRIEHQVQASAAQIEQPGCWPGALGYGPWATEIWANYLSNAVKYGGNPPQIRLGADVVPARGTVRFWVEDNGPGIAPEQQSQLFRQFSRLGTGTPDGHGLGLSIVRRITEKLGGTAGCDSTPGQSTRFWFELPTATGREKPPEPGRAGAL